MNKNDSGLTRKFDTTGVVGGKVPQKKKRRKRRTFGKIFSFLLNLLLTLLLIGIITGIIVGCTFALYIKNNLVEDYDIVGLRGNLNQTTKIYYEDETGNWIEMEDQRLHGEEDRSWVSFNQMPKNLTNAFVAIEDKRFYEHGGIDIKRTAGAVLEFVRGNSSYGGSTITQQLIKNFSLDNDTTIQRKVREIFRAISLTKKHSKSEILEMYLNTISLSNGCYGVQAASNYLFGKDVSDLSLVECAALAAIPKSPYKYDPQRHPDNNKDRRETVLYEMKDQGWITEEEYNNAISTELVLNITQNEVSEAGVNSVTSYFTDALIEQIIADLNTEYGYPRKYANDLILNGGLRIYATIDPKVQGIMDEVFTSPDTFPAVEGVQPQSAMVVADPYTGDVKGLVGGRGEKTQSRIWNRATMTKRQVGSSIKPILVYAPAMDLGYINYATVLDDTPFKYLESADKYWPSNAPNRYDGLVTVNYAIAKSKNTIAVKVLDMITPEYAFNFAKEKLGITSLEDSDMDYAPLALGGLTQGFTVMEMTAAYSIFPNSGVYSAPRLYTKVLDINGDVLLEKPVSQNVAISKATSQIMIKIMQNVLSSGTGTAVTLRRTLDCAGKTGSTNDDKDRYFCGFTPYYVGACWFGYDQPKYLGSKFSTNPALTAWDVVMTRLHEEIVEEAKNGGEPLKRFSTSELVQAEYCADSGMLATDLCKYSDPRGYRIETGWFKKGAEPSDECTTHRLVDFDPLTNAVSTGSCGEDVRQFALLYVEGRNFTSNIFITDAQYTCLDLPEDYVYPADSTVPYYANLYEEGTYPGQTAVTIPFNHACSYHLENPSGSEDNKEDTEEGLEGLPSDEDAGPFTVIDDEPEDGEDMADGGASTETPDDERSSAEQPEEKKQESAEVSTENAEN